MGFQEKRKKVRASLTAVPSICPLTPKDATFFDNWSAVILFELLSATPTIVTYFF